MKKVFSLVLISILFSSCENLKIKSTTACIQELIQDFKKDNICEGEGAKVDEYTFQNELVYVFEEGTCGADFTASVFDENCNNLGYLGGFVGNVIINGEDFSNAIFEQNIWKD